MNWRRQTLAIAAGLAVLATGITAGAAQATTKAEATDTVPLGTTVRTSQAIATAGNYSFGLNSGGWVTLRDNTNGTYVWTAPTQRLSADRLFFQGDGNLVAYKGPSAVWSTGSSGKGGTTLTVKPDKSITISDPKDGVVWQSASNLPKASGLMQLPAGSYLGRGNYMAWGPYRFGVDTTGLFGLWDNNKVVRTIATNVSHVAIQGDGNLVAYSVPGGTAYCRSTQQTEEMVCPAPAILQSGKPVWATHTKAPGSKGLVLKLQPDRNVVLYAAGSALWSTRTVAPLISLTGPTQVVAD